MGKFYESDYVEAERNYEWIKNLVTTLTERTPQQGTWEGPGPRPETTGPTEDAQRRVCVALGLAPVEVLPLAGEDGLLDVDNIALRIRERLTGDLAAPHIEKLQGSFYGAVPVGASEAAEDEEHPTLRGKLPEGFPGLKALGEADPPITTYGQLYKFLKRPDADLTTIAGIGVPTEAKIKEALNAKATQEPQPGGTSNSGVDEETQSIDQEGSDDDVKSATEDTPL